jgi:hypothetical protein
LFAVAERDHLRIPLGQHMTYQLDPGEAASHIQTALEASCGALITLESISVRTGDETPENVRRPLQQAIDSLRLAIGELRCASEKGPGVLPGEFVLRASASALGVPGGYASPRRTA